MGERRRVTEYHNMCLHVMCSSTISIPHENYPELIDSLVCQTIYLLKKIWFFVNSFSSIFFSILSPLSQDILHPVFVHFIYFVNSPYFPLMGNQSGLHSSLLYFSFTITLWGRLGGPGHLEMLFICHRWPKWGFWTQEAALYGIRSSALVSVHLKGF